MKNYLLKYTLLFCFTTLYSQVSYNSNPTSFDNDLDDIISFYNTEELDFNQLRIQDELDAKQGLPYRFGYSFDVDIDFFNLAMCDTLVNGDKVYRLKIGSKDAYSINLIFNQFYLSEGAELFVYNQDHTDVIGAFTNANNKIYKRFSTAPVLGDVIVIEYFEPKFSTSKSVINISNIINGYKDVFRGYEDSASCNNNVNCADFQSWHDEISSVVLTLTDGGTRLCSGAMVNNVNQDLALYFLTSETCLGGHEDWIFMFNYESPECYSNQDGITDQTASGATLLAHHYESDFALLKLEEVPPEEYDIYFSGWDISTNQPVNCVTIHHPVGDIKKFSYHEGFAVSDGWFFDDNTHWKISEWESGITEPGSYGAPLFNANKKIVGQLHGGESSCEEPIDDYYGKLSHSWDLGLKDWLDPGNTGVTSLEGIGVLNSPDPEITYSNDSYNILMVENELEIINCILSNTGEEGSILNYQIYNSPFSETYSMPDEQNYYWIDSDYSDFEEYYWVNINDDGNQVWFEDNDSAVGPFNIGFEFPFYNNVYSEFIISPNGWIGFGEDNPAYENISIPSSEAPYPAIFGFWDDLNPINLDSSPDMGGRVKYVSDGNRLVVSYTDVPRWGDDAPYSFQIVIYKTGHIDINYANMSGDRTSATIGIQNDQGSTGQQIIYNDSYVHNFLGVSFEQSPNWFTIDDQNYINNELDDQESINHIVQLDGYQINSGLYLTYIHIESNATGAITIPVSVQVGYQANLGDINYDGVINVQDVVLLVSMIIDDFPPNLEADINEDDEINVLDTVLLIELILS
tara:strand:+ start:7420 stop:9822 length:2403 start_codon:yes stop_codon:yes gene_type:complete